VPRAQIYLTLLSHVKSPDRFQSLLGKIPLRRTSSRCALFENGPMNYSRSCGDLPSAGAVPSAELTGIRHRPVEDSPFNLLGKGRQVSVSSGEPFLSPLPYFLAMFVEISNFGPRSHLPRKPLAPDGKAENFFIFRTFQLLASITPERVGKVGIDACHCGLLLALHYGSVSV
jgi:hypothetical protein